MKSQIIAGLPTRVCAFFALICAVLLPAPARAVKPLTTKEISELASAAFIWGYGPQFMYRWSMYNTIVGAPFNQFKYGSVPASWNNQAGNAGDASVIYLNAYVNLATNDLVLTVPPSATNYIVVAYYDAYANTIGSIGTRTTPSTSLSQYLLVGPNSPYAKQTNAMINGFNYNVMASDTDLNMFLIRVLANTLIDATNSTSVPSVLTNVVYKFALNNLYEFQTNGNQPVYPTNFFLPPATSTQVNNALPWQNTPATATNFFTQLGTTLTNNPIPKRNTGLSGMRVSKLPAYVIPQYRANPSTNDIYIVPSYGQKKDLDLFAPIGLTKNGWTMPKGWGASQLQALQTGYTNGQALLLDFISSDTSSGPSANYWGIVNDIVGVYPNNYIGYFFRSLIVVEGGVANVPLDGIYPTLTGIGSPPLSTNVVPLDGNNTYKLTFRPPLPIPTTNYPVKGIYPPMVTNSDGNPKGFWSIHVYALDKTEASSPFIAQTSVLNTNYSRVDTHVYEIDTASSNITVAPPAWGTLEISAPIFFGDNATAYGLTNGAVYYIANTPVATNINGNLAYRFQLCAQWLQTISPGGVPIQGSGTNGPIVNLLAPATNNPPALSYGMIQPVTQLGSAQVAANQMATNSDGSLTLWFGPKLPTNAPMSNWIPTPNTNYYGPIYTNQVTNTTIEVMIRMYYPRPGDQPPSILPLPAQPHKPKTRQPYTYVPPLLERVP